MAMTSDPMTREDVQAAMVEAGLERPRVILFRAHDERLFFDLCAGPDSPNARRMERVPAIGRRNAKAIKALVAEAIARLSGNG